MRIASHLFKFIKRYFPIDEVNEEKEPIQRVGSCRCIFYLEDLGPTDQLNNNEKQLYEQLVIFFEWLFDF